MGEENGSRMDVNRVKEGDARKRGVFHVKHPPRQWRHWVPFDPQSFQRKRESTARTARFQRLEEWIPAFAGMTGVS